MSFFEGFLMYVIGGGDFEEIIVIFILDEVCLWLLELIWWILLWLEFGLFCLRWRGWIMVIGCVLFLVLGEVKIKGENDVFNW